MSDTWMLIFGRIVMNYSMDHIYHMDVLYLWNWTGTVKVGRAQAWMGLVSLGLVWEMASVLGTLTGHSCVEVECGWVLPYICKCLYEQ